MIFFTADLHGGMSTIYKIMSNPSCIEELCEKFHESLVSE